MKKMILPAALLAASLMTAGCSGVGSALAGAGTRTDATTGATSTASAGTTTGLLGSLLSAVLSGSTTLSAESLAGTWQYTGPDCVFETENLLMKAGGAVAASTIESKLSDALSKVGFKPGTSSITFNTDGTYTAVLGGRSISGNYTLDATNKKITMTYLAGMATMNPHVALSGGKLSLLFEADKLLTLARGLGALTGSASAQTLSSLLSQYDGLLVGIQMQK